MKTVRWTIIALLTLFGVGMAGMAGMATPGEKAALPKPPLHAFSFTVTHTLRLEMYPVYVHGAGADFLDHRVDGKKNILLVRNEQNGFLYYSTPPRPGG